MSELQDKALAMVADPEYHGPYEHIAVIAALLAENEGLSMTNALANSTLLAIEARAEAAEAKLRELCEMEPVAWAVVSNANGFTELRSTYPERGDGVFREDVEISAIIPRPTIPESGK